MAGHILPAISHNAKELNRRCRDRCQNRETLGRFVNVYGGTYAAVAGVVKELAAKGYKAKIANGPLMRPSSGNMRS